MLNTNNVISVYIMVNPSTPVVGAVVVVGGALGVLICIYYIRLV